MAEKRYYWLKLKEDYFNNPKIKKLRKIAGGDTYTIIYLKMQLLSIKNEGIIEYEGIEPTFEEELALKLDEDIDNVKITLSFLQSQSLVDINDKEYMLLEATNNIGSESQSAERVRRFREKNNQKSLQCNSNVTDMLQNSISISNSISSFSSNSNINNNSTNNKESTNKRFTPPTFEEVSSYCEERQNGVDAQRFIDFYASKGWKVGNQAMKDWKACIRTWEKREKPKTNETWVEDMNDLQRKIMSMDLK